jgi:AcrR family transcriptional regulator
MASTTSPRDRLLQTATRLFYAEGVHAVGVDRIILEAGVAKATFYHHFRTKDDLVRAYLCAQSDAQRAKAAELPGSSPHEKLLAIFESVGELGRSPDYRGCPFVNAAAEFPDPRHPVRQAVADHRMWFRSLVLDLLRSAKHPDADRTVELLVALKDGLLVGADLDHGLTNAAIRDAVTTILDTATAKR